MRYRFRATHGCTADDQFVTGIAGKRILEAQSSSRNVESMVHG